LQWKTREELYGLACEADIATVPLVFAQFSTVSGRDIILMMISAILLHLVFLAFNFACIRVLPLRASLAAKKAVLIL